MPQPTPLLTTEAISPLWLGDWSNFTDAPTCGLKEWIRNEEFQVYSPQNQDRFSLDFLPNHSPLQALAHDSNRFLSASLETLSTITAHPHLPKSSGWLVVKSYYAAFFAAHSILRVFGSSCSHLESPEITSINKIASLYQTSWTHVGSGSYLAHFNASKNIIEFESSSKRAHELLWFMFKNQIENWLNHLTRPGAPTTYQLVILNLQSLLSNLTYRNHKSGGNWLSSVRNDVNYQHTRSLWFPYAGIRTREVESLYRLFKSIPNNTFEVDLANSYTDELARFFRTTIYVVTLAKEVMTYMNTNSRGGSFHKHGPARLHRILDNL